MEDEYMSLTETVKETQYLHDFLREIGVHSKQTINILCDNVDAGKLGKNPVFHAQTKHIDIKHHLVREVIAKGIMEVNYIPTERMIADVLTKALREKHAAERNLN